MKRIGRTEIVKKLIAAILALCLVLGGAALAEEAKIGILVPEGEGGEAAAVAYWAEERAIELGVPYMLCACTDEKTGMEQLDDMNVWGALALVICPGFEGAQNVADAARDVGLSVVSVNTEMDGAFLAKADDYDIGVQSAYFAADALEGAGEIAALVSSGKEAQERLAGFTDALEEIAPGLTVVEVQIVTTSRRQARDAMADLLDARETVDALFVSDDLIALGVWDALDAAGREDVCAVISCGGRQEFLRLIRDSEAVSLCTALRAAAPAMDAVDMAYLLAMGEAVESVRVSDADMVTRENVAGYMDPDNPY